MEQKLQALYNTLGLIEVKGQSALTMADSLRYLQQLINDEKKKSENSTKKE